MSAIADMKLTERQVVVHILSAQIAACLYRQRSEERYPTRSGDEMDDIIRMNNEAAAKLRTIRADYEDLLAGSEI